MVSVIFSGATELFCLASKEYYYYYYYKESFETKWRYRGAVIILNKIFIFTKLVRIKLSKMLAEKN